MNGPDWRTSSYSIACGDCVEAASDGTVLVRDSTAPEGAQLAFPAAAWSAFAARLKAA